MENGNSRQIKMGALLSYFQMFMNVVIGLVYTPVMLRLLGQTEYGLYNTVSSTISMLAVLNLGFNGSYIRYYAKYKNEENMDAIYRLNGLFLIIFIVIGIVAMLCGTYLAFNLNLVFKNGLTEGEYATAKVLMLLLTLNLAVSFITNVFSNIISANERFIFLKLIGMIRTVLSPLVSLPLLLMGYKSIALVCVTVTLSFITDAVYVYYVFKKLKYKFYFKNIEKGLFVDLFAFTSFIAINLIIDQINWNIDKMLLARFKGVISVAIYSVGYTLTLYYQMFSMSISNVFTPKIHTIVASNKDIGMRNKQLTDLFVRVGRIQFIVLALVASGIVLFGEVFIKYWAGDGYNDSYYVALLLIIPITIPLIQNVGIEIQRAENKHKFRSIVYTIMAIINLISSIYLCQIYGPIGSAIGTFASLILANGIIMNIYYHKRCGIDIIKFWTNILRVSIGLVAPIVCGIFLKNYIKTDNMIELIGVILIYSCIYIISMWLVGMDESERDLIAKPIKAIGAKICRK